MVKRKRKNNNVLIICLLCIVVIASIISVVAVTNINEKPVKTEELFYDFNVTGNPGFKLDTDAMHFGGITPGGNSKRPMTITTAEDYLVKIRFEGDGSLIVSENNFIIEANEEKTLEFTLTPTTSELGYYSGTIFFDFYKPK